jgi:uncharacterized membrane protein YkgB
LLAMRRWWPTLCAVGSLGAALMFLFTLSFAFTTPGQSVELTGYGARRTHHHRRA